jgi:hypothetical protein
MRIAPTPSAKLRAGSLLGQVEVRKGSTQQPNPLTPFPVKEGGTENNFYSLPLGEGELRIFFGV